MDINDLKFNYVFKEKGGIFDPDTTKNIFFENIKNTIERRRAFFLDSYPSLPPIHGGFIQNLSLNAMATYYKNEYFIGVNLGTYLLMYDMFEKIFASNNLLTNYGDASKETAGKLTLNAIAQSNQIEYDINSTNLFKIINTERRYLASRYTEWALKFLIDHEFCHIIRGHLGYVGKKYSNQYWVELTDKNSFSNEEMFIFQTLEMDADSFATNRALIDATALVDRYNELSNSDKMVFIDTETFLMHWIFVIYSVFRLFGITDFKENDVNKSSHPPPSIRMHMVLINIESILENNGIDKVEIEKQTTKNFETILIAENAFTSITYHKDLKKVFFNNYNLALDYVLNLLNNWNNVRPLIEPFAFGPLPPFI